jgi:NAD(P)-dependent dehydrogenase (short-subunit alcohol dehydrogenase family)
MAYALPHASTDLAGRVALVTGASSGLGVRFAHVLASQGASVILAARRADRLAELAAEINAAGGKALAVQMDATNADDLIAAIAAGEAAFGTVDILINNAGIPDAQRAHKMSVDLIDRVIDVNLRAPFILAGEFARRLIAAEKPLYSVTKTGIARMTETLAVEWARFGINVNAIAPGMVRSEMLEGMLERMGDLAQHTPRKRIIDTAQLDTTLLYLVGPASDAVTGAVIRVDDGQSARS